MTKNAPARLALLLLLSSACAGAWSADDAAMRALATLSGCLSCHTIDPGTTGPDGPAPIAPAWRDVAAKYRGQKDALDTLTATVLKGSSPYASHWQGQVSGFAMPPNAVAIQPADARVLVKWILALKPTAKS